MVLRVLDKSAVNLDLDNLGLPENVKTEFETQFVVQIVFLLLLDQQVQEKQPPFSALQEVNNMDTKLLTAEIHLITKLKESCRFQLIIKSDWIFLGHLRPSFNKIQIR